MMKQFIIAGSIFLLLISGVTAMADNDKKVVEVQQCGFSPNCVSSVGEKGFHWIEPFSLISSPTVSIEKIKNIVSSMNLTTIIKEEPYYLHIEFRSRVFGFVDDVEFIVNEDKEKIDVRSESRAGFYDFGVNKRRIEKIRAQYER